MYNLRELNCSIARGERKRAGGTLTDGCGRRRTLHLPETATERQFRQQHRRLHFAADQTNLPSAVRSIPAVRRRNLVISRPVIFLAGWLSRMSKALPKGGSACARAQVSNTRLSAGASVDQQEALR
jgi:hypothetical protein